jgi:hypothetical protein
MKDPRADWAFPPERRFVVREFTVTIPGKPVNLNDMIRLKGSRYKGAWNKAKIKHEAAIKLAWVKMSIAKGGAQIVDGPYKVRYLLLCKDRRSDPSNLAAGAEKTILDALVDAGAIPGDGFKHHRASSWEAIESKGWGVVVTVKAV